MHIKKVIVALGCIFVLYFGTSCSSNNAKNEETVSLQTSSEVTTPFTYLSNDDDSSNAMRVVWENSKEITTLHETSVHNEESVTDNEENFSLDIFYDGLLTAINLERKENDDLPLTIDYRLNSACAVLCNDLKNDKYKKGTSKDYFKALYSDSNFYYERSYDLSAYTDEFKAATELIKYEADNYSSKWRESKYTHLGVYAEKNEDGTFYIVWVMASNK